MFGRKRMIEYDRQTSEPAIRKSICTGETSVGFVDLRTGRFTDYMRVTSPEEIADFCRRTGTSPDTVRTIY